MKKGDIVTVNDFSYSRIVEGGKLSNEFHAFHPAARKQFVVIETNCAFPRISTWPGTNVNDTVIQAVSGTEVVFIEERFLCPVLPKHTIMIDVTIHQGCFIYGNTNIIEISNELYKRIKNEPQA